MLPLISVTFAVIAGVIWIIFLRPVPTQTAFGAVLEKNYKPPGEYTQVHGGTRDAFHLPTTISIAEGYVVEIKLDEEQGTVSSLLNSIEAERYEVGTRVKVEYSLRSVPMLWQKCYVHSVALAEET
ncbi:hypothetical protein [Aureliella helgolandensis]|uniref:Uncharacterized protein n=1 Tax=Aureliella helgolandensis TaxID=2527968 RepID=A0A518GCS5_9BACT|nr:hypothetical protein [Aureliella helgolandensis]QDV26401.1 hypothetical protein Q31a_47750 [Aureliella helgolandensis]